MAAPLLLNSSETAVLPRIPVALAPGDGVGPEIATAVRQIVEASGARISWTDAPMGLSAHAAGAASGISDAAWAAVEETGLLLKGPMGTPQGGGMKSVNVTLRKSLGLYACIRPCVSLAPYVPSSHPGMDVTIVRENEEDLYAGIEHRQSEDVVQCLKLITRPGCERICRTAFAWARAQGRTKVTCMTKDNIMKMTDGLFHRVFDEVSADYPEITANHMIIDIGMARAAKNPERFEVIVTPNLYGDILSDVLAEQAGGIGLAPSMNLGVGVAMFEAVHGTAPDIAGQNIANPGGLLLAACLMLNHVGEGDAARKIHGAFLRTLEDGVHTADLVGETTTRTVGTREFADAVVERLGQEPETLRVPEYRPFELPAETPPTREAVRKTVGMDVFVSDRGSVESLVNRLQAAADFRLRLSMVTCRGVRVWPQGNPRTRTVDHYRCRFVSPTEATNTELTALLDRIDRAGLDWVKTETLKTFDGERGYSQAQGE